MLKLSRLYCHRNIFSAVSVVISGKMVRRGKNVDHSNIPSITSDACSKSVETADSLQQVLQSRVVPTHNHYFVMMSSFQYLNFTFIWRIILFRFFAWFSTFCIKIFVQLGPRKSVQSDAVVWVLGVSLQWSILRDIYSLDWCRPIVDILGPVTRRLHSPLGASVDEDTA